MGVGQARLGAQNPILFVSGETILPTLDFIATPRFEWQPIDTAPQDGTALLLFHPYWDMLQVGICYAETEMWQQPSGDLLHKPTHWMRLPPAPEQFQAAE